MTNARTTAVAAELASCAVDGPQVQAMPRAAVLDCESAALAASWKRSGTIQVLRAALDVLDAMVIAEQQDFSDYDARGYDGCRPRE